jgi:coproporphyrinogen III oxidase
MSTIQDLEQEVLRCWEITQDLKLLAEVVNDGSDHTETVKGIAEVYELRFEKAWKTYEYLVDEYYSLRKRNEARDVNFDD